MAKNREKGEGSVANPKERESVLVEQKRAHEELERKIKSLKDSGKKIDSEIDNLFALNALEFQNIKIGNQQSFVKSMKKVQGRMEEIKIRLESTKPVENRVTEKSRQDIKKSEVVVVPGKKKTDLAKEQKAGEVKKEKEAVLVKLNETHKELGTRIKELEKGGKIDSLLKNLHELNASALSNAKPSNDKFDDEMAKVQGRIDRITKQIDAGITVSQEPDKLHQDIKKLEAQAATEDTEFSINLNHYTESEAKLNTLFELIKNNNIELDEKNKGRQVKLQALLDDENENGMMAALTAEQYDRFKKMLHDFTVTFNLLRYDVNDQLKKQGKLAELEHQPVVSEEESPELKQEVPEEIIKQSYKEAMENFNMFRANIKKYKLNVDENTVEDFSKRLTELSDLTTADQFEDFRDKLNEFNEDLGLLLSELKKEAKTKKTEKQEGKEEKEQEERDLKYNKQMDNFNLLGRILKGRKLVDRYREQMRALQGYLRIADQAADESKDSAVFWKNINNFNNDLDSLLADLDPDIKALPEIKTLSERRKVKEEKLVNETEEPKKEPEKETGPVLSVEAENAALEDVLAQWKLFEVVGAEKLSNKEKTREINEIIKNINYSLYLAVEAKKANRPSDIDEQMKILGSSFNELLSKIPEDVKKEFESRLAGNAPSLDKTKKEEPKKESEKEAEPVLAVETENAEVENKELEDAFAQWKLFEAVKAKLLSRENQASVKQLIGIMNEIVYKATEAKKANDLHDINTQLGRFKYSFNLLLSKIPEDVKKEFESQLAGNAPSWEKVEEEKPVQKLVQKETATTPEQESFVEKGMLKMRFFNGIGVIMRDKMRFLDKIPRVQQIKRSMDYYLKQVSAALDNKDKDAYLKHTEQLTKLTEELVGFFPKGAQQEYLGRLKGEETEGLKVERQEEADEIKFQEDRLAFLEELMDSHNPALRTKFASQIQSIKDALSEAVIYLGNEPEDVIKARDIYREKREIVIKGFTVLLNSIGGEAQKEIMKAFLKKFPYESLLYHKTLPEKPAEVLSTKVETEIDLEKVAPEIVEEIEIAKEMPAPTQPKKKGLWERLKGGVKQVFSRETGKVAGKVTYDTVFSVLGLKLATDAVRWVATGKGDLAMWWKGRKESKESVESVAAAYQTMLELLDEAQNNKILGESEKTAKRVADFRKKIESAKIPDEMRMALLERLDSIDANNQEDLDKARKERDEAIHKIKETYEERKVSDLETAKHAMNFVLTATGFSMLRGLMYAGVSVVERIKKAKKEYSKQTTEEGTKKSELGFVAKDVMVNAAVETVHGLTGGLFSKEKLGAKRRTLNFIKSLGTVARGLGIYGVAFSSSDSTSQSIDKFLAGAKEHGVVAAMAQNMVHNAEHVYENAERAGHLVANPEEIFTGSKDLTAPIQAPEYNVSLPLHEHLPTTPHHEVVAPTETAPAAPHEVPVTAEVVNRGDHTVAIVELNNKEGILNGVNKIIHNNPNVFVHENGKAWSADEMHTWKVRELKDMGFKIEGDKWGNPVTVHGGAKVEVFTDENGQPHFKLASEEHVTFNKNYHWEETKSADHAAAEHLNNKAEKLINPYPDNKADQLINPYPENTEHPTIAGYHRGVQMPENSTAAEKLQYRDLLRQYAAGNMDPHEFAKESSRLTKHVVIERVGQNADNYFEQSIAPTAEHQTVVEHPITHKEVPVDSKIKEMAVVHHTEKTGKSIGSAAEARIGKSVQENVAPVKNVAATSEKVSIVPEVVAEKGTLRQVLAEQKYKYDKTEFLDNIKKMRVDMAARWEKNLIFTGDSEREKLAFKFLQEKMDHMYEQQVRFNSDLDNVKLSDTDTNQIKSLLVAEGLYKQGKSGWETSLDKALFSSEDNKVLDLLSLSHRSPNSHPILVNNSHAVRIWDSAKKKDVLWYDPNKTFSLDSLEKGNLVETGVSGRKVIEKSEVLKKVSE